jgi:hypothetical protein
VEWRSAADRRPSRADENDTWPRAFDFRGFAEAIVARSPAAIPGIKHSLIVCKKFRRMAGWDDGKTARLRPADGGGQETRKMFAAK